jgi:Rieske Fe-S protein
MNRREFLQHVGVAACACCWVAACGPDEAEDGADYCSRQATEPPPDWVAVRLDEHPELYEVGGSAKIDRPERFLKVHVVHVRDGCFVAAGRICTHGACELDVHEVTVDRDADTLFTCPCHGSRFGPDGRVKLGPATEPIGTFEIRRTEDTLWIQPPDIG